MAYPETAQEALTQWDKGDTVWTDDRAAEFQSASDRCVHRVSKEGHDVGFSGAQVGAAVHFAFCALRDGWRHQLDAYKAADADRLTMVSRSWPHIDVPVMQ